MRILFLGDIMGRSGREAVLRHLPHLKSALDPDIIIVNGENAAAGFGITPDICRELYSAGVDCITTGNHVWGQKDLVKTIDKDPRLLRPLNYPEGTPGRGLVALEDRKGRKVVVASPQGRVFMDAVDDPFATLDKALRPWPLGSAVQAIVVDIHAEATSEKMAMGHWLDGRVSLVVGTHTHIPTADTQILPKGTAYHTDAGMCGDYDSVIGMGKANCIERFLRKTPVERMAPADQEGTVCGVWVETDDKTGLALRAEPVRIGPRLMSHVPVRG
ncbi:MAG: TIGR00282 family metallophosphoesterase [Pseudomonadota bacterium]|nr:TIGR00282 family metallophosphoesterase [Pseudomonadota bacterium]